MSTTAQLPLCTKVRDLILLFWKTIPLESSEAYPTSYNAGLFSCLFLAQKHLAGLGMEFRWGMFAYVQKALCLIFNIT